MLNLNLLECSHLPGTSGDHAPIHFAQIEHDEPLYIKYWDNPENEERIKIDINNWKNSPKIWERRSYKRT